MNKTMNEVPERRPIAVRTMSIFQWLTRVLAGMGATPDGISIASILFGVAAGGCLAATGCPELTVNHRVWWLLGAGLIVLRLLANMMDGLVAVEAGKGGPLGALYNEVPDRISDVAILVGVGYAAGGSLVLGLWASVLAVMTAYIRAQGAVAGATQAFQGPMAKPHRMWLIVAAAVYSAVTPVAWQPVCPEGGWGLMTGVLILIIAGSAITCIQRLRAIARELKS